MTTKDKKFIIACVLGDGCINQRFVNNTVQARFMLRHSNKQFDYFIWKVDRLKSILDRSQAKNFTKKSSHFYEDNSGRSNILSVKFERNHPYFKILYPFIYRNGHKTFSRKVLNRLDAEGLAVWWMDDGSLYNHKYKGNLVGNTYSKCSGILNTYLSKEENEVIIKYFNEVWGVTFRLEKEKKFYRLRLNTTECRKLFPIIEPYIVPSMLYKIDIKVGKRIEDNTHPLPSNVEGEDMIQE